MTTKSTGESPKEYTVISKNTIVTLKKPGVAEDLLTKVLRNGAKKMLAATIEAEAEEFFLGQCEQQIAPGKARFVRHGYLPKREIQTGIGDGRVQVRRARNLSLECERLVTAILIEIHEEWPAGKICLTM